MTQNAPLITSFILSYSEIDNNPKYQTYLSIKDSAKAKYERGQELTELEQECIDGEFEFRGYSYVGYGKWLFEQQRYYDSFSILERAFNCIRPRLDKSDTNLVDVFYNICNMMGACLSKMDRFDEACFYFRQGAPGLTLTESNKLALCYANLGNPIAIKRMNDWLMLVANKYGDDKNWSEEVKNFSVDVPIALMSYKKKLEEKLALVPRYSDVITIGYILKELWGLNKRNIVPCMFVYNIEECSFMERIDDVDVIFDYVLNNEAAYNKVFVLSCTYAHYKTNDEEDKSILCHNAPIIISTHCIKGKECTANMRIDMIRHNFSNNDDKRDFVRQNIPLNATYTLGLPSGISCSSDKDGLLAAIRKGVKLVDEKRFVEAYKLSKWVLERALNSIKDETGIRFESEDELLWDIFFESSYNAGYCLMELNKVHAAAYYLEIASHSMNCTHIQEYINCLVNSKDHLALDIVEEALENSPKPEDEEYIPSHYCPLKKVDD